MLDKIKAWGQAAYNEVEATLGGDSAEQERLQNMRKRLGDGAQTTSLNLNDVKCAAAGRNRRGFAHWFLKPKNGEVAREEVYNDLLHKLSGARSVGTLLEYEKSWTEMTLRNTGTSDTWAIGGIDPGGSGTMDKKMIEQRLEKLGDMVAERTEDDTTSSHFYREPDPMGIECSNDAVLGLPCFTSTDPVSDWEPCARIEGAVGAFDAESDTVELEAPAVLRAVQLHAVKDDEPVSSSDDDEPTHPYSNHNLHWIFEFSGPADADINRGKHRIRRVVGF